ncbi:MAG: exodeoxyribonuclease III [SAR324 cluster bacterium]|nr:exodeoxyribonuclease III [SAR324 cluster bacterium]
MNESQTHYDSELLQFLSDRIRLSELRHKFKGNMALVASQLYDLWRSGQLHVHRDWGNTSQKNEKILYTNRTCLLPTDWLQIVKESEHQQSLLIATWNINSIRSRMPLLLSWLEEHRPDIICLQETKVEDHLFPHQELGLSGYQTVFSGQKTYNGVAILSRHPIEEVKYGFSNRYDSENKRLIAAKILGIWIINVYVPQGQSTDSPKFSYKIEFLKELFQELEQFYDSSVPLLLAGDYNIAPDSRDVSHPEAMENQVSFHPREHQFLDQIRKWKLEDVFRKFNQEKGHYSWWDFRTMGFEKDEGMRIDHIWVSPSLMGCCKSCVIDIENRGQPKPSDHAPVLSEFSYQYQPAGNSRFDINQNGVKHNGGD